MESSRDKIVVGIYGVGGHVRWGVWFLKISFILILLLFSVLGIWTLQHITSQSVSLETLNLLC